MTTKVVVQADIDRKVNAVLDFLELWFIKYTISLAFIFGYYAPRIINAIGTMFI